MLSQGPTRYDAGRLRSVFGAFGPVEDLVLKESSKKKKKSALVVMATVEAAAAAAEAVCGDVDSPLLVVPLSKVWW